MLDYLKQKRRLLLTVAILLFLNFWGLEEQIFLEISMSATREKFTLLPKGDKGRGFSEKAQMVL